MRWIILIWVLHDQCRWKCLFYNLFTILVVRLWVGKCLANMYLKNEHLKVDDQGKVSQSDIATYHIFSSCILATESHCIEKLRRFLEQSFELHQLHIL